MPLAPKHRLPTRLFLFASILIFLAACSRNPVVETSTPIVTATTLPSPSPTPPPSPTPQPDTVVLVVPLQAEAGMAETIQNGLSELADKAGMALAVRTQLAPSELTPADKIVVVLAPDPGLAALTASAPSTQFVGIGIPNLQTATNLSVIGGSDPPSVQAAFLAGYVAAIATPDWRVAVLSRAGDPLGEAIRDAFLNGGRYLCGLCNPKYPPYAGYPVAVEVEAGGDWQPALDSLAQKAVRTVYVDPGLGTPELLAALGKAGIQIVGSTAPTQDLRAQWIATVSADPAVAFAALWPDLLVGKAGAETVPVLVVSEVNSASLTTGRMRLVQQVIQDLTQGSILPSNPAQ